MTHMTNHEPKRLIAAARAGTFSENDPASSSACSTSPSRWNTSKQSSTPAAWVPRGLIPAGMMTSSIRFGSTKSRMSQFLQRVLGSALSRSRRSTSARGVARGRPFADVFRNPQTFTALAQAFEDTGVRAYKGQAANLMGHNAAS